MLGGDEERGMRTTSIANWVRTWNWRLRSNRKAASPPTKRVMPRGGRSAIQR